MKKLILSIMICLAGGMLSAQTYFFPQEGKTNIYKMTAEGAMGTNSMIIAQSIANQEADKITLKTESLKEDGTEAMPTISLTFTKTENGFNIPLNEIYRSQLNMINNIEVLESAGDFSWPDKLNIGDKLQKAYTKIKGNVQGMDIEAEITIDGREVLGEESIQVPAGKFNCIKVKENVIVDMMGQQITVDSTMWYAEGVGMIKQTNDIMGMTTTTMELKEIK